MRNQIKFVFQIGYAEENECFEAAVIAAASKLCGGCTTSAKAGWWCEDGASHAETFKGALQRERCFELELTCEQRKAERVYDVMASEIADAARYFEVATDWVHVSETAMRGRHFSVEAINAQNAA